MEYLLFALFVAVGHGLLWLLRGPAPTWNIILVGVYTGMLVLIGMWDILRDMKRRQGGKGQ